MSLFAFGLQGLDDRFPFLVAMAPPPPGTNPILALLPYLLVIVAIFIVINLLVDLLYSVLDPRVRLTESKG